MSDFVKHISIAKDFSLLPHGRLPQDGASNGTTFREKVLAPAVAEAVQNRGRVIVDLDGVKALGSSFAEEAFGGLVRQNREESDTILRSIEIRFTQPWLQTAADDIRHYMQAAATA